MKILIISESINVEDSSASKGRVALIHNLKKAGFDIKVLHFSHKEIHLPDIDCTLIKENKFSILYLLSRFVRVFQRSTKVKINTKIERIFGFSFTHTNDTNAIAKSIRENQNFNPDLIFTLSKGGSFRPHRAMLKLPELHSKWMAYIHDPYPFHFYPRPYNFVEESYEAKEKMMNAIMQKAKFVSFPSLLLKEWMQSYFPEIEHKSSIIPHQVKVETELQPPPDFFQKDQFSLLHAGNLLAQRNPKFLIEAFLNFIEKNPEAKQNAKLYFVGNYFRHKEILEQYLMHPNIVIHSYIEYKQIQSIEKEAAVNIILEAISEISPFLPGKFPNCVKVDKPILLIGPYYSEVKRLLGNDYPFWSEANDAEKIEEKITQLYQIWKQNPADLKLNRSDLADYCNEIALKAVIDNLRLG
jgi:glycosyltransferase involved in cell wall biosynthesis